MIAASAGGVEALRTLLRALPANLPAAVFVVLHRSAATNSVLEQVIGDGLKVSRAEDQAKITMRHVFVAPPDRHLVLERGRMRVRFGPKVNGHRPAADVLFQSAARVHGARVIGVVLTGALSDGAAGLAEIKASGGLAMVQDPNEAFHSGMPRSALAATTVDHVLPMGQIAPKLASLVHNPVRIPSRPGRRTTPAILQPEPVHTLICPQCGGPLRETPKSRPAFFRCHTGHGFTLPSLADEHGRALEAALWTAVRTLKERATLQRHLAQTTGNRRFLVHAESSETHAATIETMLELTLQ